MSIYAGVFCKKAVKIAFIGIPEFRDNFNGFLTKYIKYIKYSKYSGIYEIRIY